MNIKINKPEQQIRMGSLIVSNHLSYLDAIILCAHYPACFVTSVEIKNTFFLGQITQLAGCLFVERRSRMNLTSEVSDITNTLKNNTNVIIFPEGTSTNGETILRFKKPLFQAAIDAQCSIQPITLNYLRVNDEPLTSFNRDLLFWYGDMTFMSHLWKFLKQKKVTVEIKIGSNLKSVDRNDLSLESFNEVFKNFRSIPKLYITNQ